MAAQDDVGRNVMTASGDTLSHPGERSERIVKSYVNESYFVSGRPCLRHHSQFAVTG
jgi:hypothetical protein